MKNSTFKLAQITLTFFIVLCIAAAIHCGIKLQQCNAAAKEALESEWVDGETSDERADLEQCQVCGAVHQVGGCPLEPAE